jgi:hypothetical protein
MKYATWEDLRKKIRSVQTNYRKVLKKLNNDSRHSRIRTDAVYQPKCWTFRELLLLFLGWYRTRRPIHCVTITDLLCYPIWVNHSWFTH